MIKQSLKTRARHDITWDRYGQSISGQLIPTKSELERSDKIKFDSFHNQDIISKQPYQEYYLNPDLLIDIGTFNDVLRKDGKFIGISLYGNVIAEKRALKEAGIENIQIRYEMKFQNNALNHHNGEIRGGQFHLEWDWSEGREKSKNQISLKIDGIKFSVDAQNVISEPIRSGGSSIEENIPYESQANAEELKDSIVYSIKDFLSSIHAIYGLRGFEETSYLLSDIPPSDTDFMLLHDRSLAMNSLLPYNRELESQLSSWFKKLLDVEISFELLPGKTAKIKAKNAYGETSFINEGLGIHQLLFMFLPIAMSPPSHTFLISSLSEILQKNSTNQ